MGLDIVGRVRPRRAHQTQTQFTLAYAILCTQKNSVLDGSQQGGRPRCRRGRALARLGVQRVPVVELLGSSIGRAVVVQRHQLGEEVMDHLECWWGGVAVGVYAQAVGGVTWAGRQQASRALPAPAGSPSARGSPPPPAARRRRSRARCCAWAGRGGLSPPTSTAPAAPPP